MSLRELMTTYHRGFEDDEEVHEGESDVGELPSLDTLKQRALEAALSPVHAAKDRAADALAAPLKAAKRQALETVAKPLKYAAAGAGLLVVFLVVLPSLSRRKDDSSH